MSNGDEAMSPAEFAKLMGAYPEPVGNPLPAYGGYMDNSPANFAWVNNNDYFGAEGQANWGHHLPLIISIDTSASTDSPLRENGLDWDNINRQYKEMARSAIVKLGPKQVIIFDHNGTVEQVYAGDDLGAMSYLNNPDNLKPRNGTASMGAIVEAISTLHGHKLILTDGGWQSVDDAIRRADTDLTPTNHMNNSIGQVVPITNPMELPTNLIETEAGGGPEGQITPDIFSAESKKGWHGWHITRYGDERYAEKDGVQVIIEPISKGSYHYHPRDAKWKLTYGRETPHGVVPLAKLFGTYGEVFEWLNNPPFAVKSFGAETFEAPYGGAGSLMDIGKETPLADFTGKELAESSAIHGDFDQASLNYSGHQNLEVRAESEEELYDCVSCGEPAVSMTLDECLDCGQQYNAEFEDLTENLVEVVNVLGEGVARIRIEDTEYDEDENIVTEDVDIEITDMDGNTLHEQTLDDSWSPYDDRDDYLESEMVETAKKHPMALLLGGLFGATVILKPEIFQPVTNTISSIFEGVKANFNSDTQEVLENDPELVENPDTGDLDPAQYEELVVESTGLALDVIPMSLDPSFMGSRFAALPTERYVEYNDPGIGAHTDIAMNRDEKFLEPEMAMVQAAEEGNEVKEAQAPGQSPYMSVDGQEPKDFNYRVIHETSPISLDPAVKPFIPQSMAGYTGNANTPPSVLNKMFNIGVLGQTPLFVAGQGDIGSSHTGSRNALPNSLGIAGSVGGPLSDKVNANYTDGTTSMSLAQWAIENTVSQSSDTEAIVIDRSSGAMKRVRRV